MSRFVLTAQLQLQAPNNVAQVVRQIQSQLNNVQVNVQVQGTQTAQRQIQQLTRQTDNATTAAQRMGRAFAISVRRFAAFSIATRAVSLFTSTLSDAVKTAIDFEREMVRVSQVTGDSLAKLKSFSKVVTDLSTSFGVASSDILQSGQLLLQAGISAKDTEVALKSLAKAALAPNFDSLSETTEGAIAILAQFGEGVGALEKQLGSINAVAGAFAVEAGDLIDVIRRAGGVFKSSGGDLNELIALFTSVRATTRESAESIGTGLRTIFTRIQRPKTIEFLKQFGVELVDLEGKFVGPFEAVRRLSEALSGLGEGDITFIRIAEELGGFRQIGKVLPLLQQFSVAQSALNVANKAGNSLTQDAATAQQALAVRITKVREEFLALIRSVTETATFQIMANTALTLASALIKVADAIKPLLPLLTALTAIRIAKGLGSFVGSFAGGLSSSRTFNKGGKVHHFARGGMVPGTGNRDTVPAMLQPGEFVIRKSSVNKLGASNLAAMNENRFANGAKITKAQSMGMSTKDVLSASRSSISIPRFSKESSVGIATTSYMPTPTTSSISINRDSDLINQVIGGVGYSIASKFGAKDSLNAVQNIFKGRKNFQYGAIIEGIGKDEEVQFASIINESISMAIDNSANRFATEVMKTSAPGQIKKIQSFYDTLDQGFRGQLFENTISALAGKPLSGQESSRPFDFTRGIGKFKGIYSNLGMNYVDAKITSAAAGLGKAGMLTTSGEGGLKSKIAGQLALEALPFIKQIIPQKSEAERQKELTRQALSVKRKSLGGIIQKFNAGGVAKVKSIKFSNFRDIEKFLHSMWVDGIQKKRLSGERITSSDSWTFKHPSIGSVSLTGRETDELYSYFESQRKSLIRNKGFRTDPTEAILSYKDNSADINMGLTDKKLTDEQKKEVSTLKKIATDKLPKTLYSGIGASRTSIIQSQVGKNLLQSVGKSFGLPGFLSTSSDIKVAKTFGNGLLLRIATNPSRKGIAADKHVSNEYQHEKEFILPPNSKFRVNRSTGNILDIAQLNKGGGVGTDTVPALLTPGEFVVNRKSAQSIGYGALNRMNKVGKYAKGGIVQQFATGTSGTGAKKKDIAGSEAFGLNPSVFTALEKTVFSLMDVFRGVGSESKKTINAFQSIAITSPELVDSIRSNSIANNRTKTSQEKIAIKYDDLINNMIKQGKSHTEVNTAIKKYITALDKDTKAKNTSAATTQKSSSTNQAVRINPAISNTGGYIPSSTLSRQARNLANAQAAARAGAGTSPRAPTPMGSPGSIPGMTNNTTAINTNTKAQQSAAKSAMDVVSGNKMFAASMATSLIQGFLPAVDENSGALLRVTHSLLSLSTTIFATAAALEAMNIQLTASSVLGFFTGKGFNIPGLSGGLSSLTQAVTKFIGPLSGVTLAFFAIKTASDSLIEAFMNYEQRIKQATESGNIEQARSIASEKQNVGTASTAVAASAAGAIIGGTIGTIIGSFGGLAGQIIGLNTGMAIGSTAAIFLATSLSDLAEYSSQVSATQASLAKSQQSLAKASEDATTALSNFEKGNISSTDLLKSTSIASADAARARAESDKLSIQTNKEVGREGSFAGLRGGLRNVFTLGGLIGESTGERQTRLQQEEQKSRKEVDKREQEVIKVAQPGLNALSKTVIAAGGSFDDLMAKIRETDPKLFDILVRQGTKPLIDSFANLEKEAKRVRAALDAANLGLRGAEAISTAMSASMDRFAAGFEVGGSAFVANAEFLSQAMTSAAQAMDPNDIKSAVTDVSANLRSMGVSDNMVRKFEGNTNAFVQAQQNYGQAFDNIIKEAKAQGKIFSADELKDKFAQEIGTLFGPDISEEAKKNITAIIGNIELKPEEVNQILEGNYKVFGDKLTEAGQKQIADILKISQERQKAEQVLIDLTKRRIESERKLVEAQQEALDLFLEGREVQAGAGGRAVTEGERRGVILGRANAQGDRLGLTSLRTGSAAELRRRNIEMVAGAAGFEGAARTQGGLQGAAGATAAENQKDLQQAYKQQVDTIRSLIKLEQEELKIIQEKNKLEKDSLESLISGDIDKFFEQQAAVGATAAIATGDERLMQSFGAKALGDAFKNLQAQQQAGVQSAFGMQLGGAGGLLEMGASAALAARGVTDPFAARTLAGTSPEEESRKARIRELGGILSETGQVGVDMARMELNSAEIIVSQANIKLQEITQRGVAAAEQAAGRSRGGMVYASNGIFVPRGTDTVPAMLTPGEFVVNRGAVNRGNNLQILQAMNNGANAAGMNRGGKVSYYNKGGKVQYLADGDLVSRITQAFTGIDPKIFSGLIQGLNSFNTQLKESIASLQNTKFQVKLETSTINVNLNGGSFLQNLTENVTREVMGKVGAEISNWKAGPGGNLTRNQGVLNNK